MIAHISGKLIQKQPNQVVIDVGGVGYEISIPLSTFYEVGELGSDLSLNIHTHVREDALLLFGFRTKGEKELFLKLTGVSGIGPKLAITILSGMPVQELVPAIRSNDLARLTSIPGVGRKTAERLVVELRDKLGAIQPEPGTQATVAVGVQTADLSLVDDTVSALIGLGYPRAVAERTVSAALSEDGDRTIESVLKRCLKRLSR
ncbi:MAG TPA: Holliday junction branch migration protein RuvA [Blastocatellia bacterium]|nr:Holliday junction branch migration protein RuvA [Blastocatellia bacterium]